MIEARQLLFFAAAFFMASPSLRAEAPEGYRLLRQAGGFSEYELQSNGLRVILKEDHSAPVATAMINYKVGLKNETGERTEAAHILEHMSFKGTARYNRESGTHVAAVLQQAGAEINATTDADWTRYYATLPSEKLDLALTIQADQMRGLLLREEDVRMELPVVENELKRIENSPVNALLGAVWRTAFTRHPYRHLVLGSTIVDRMTPQALRSFYDTYYWPDNAVLTVVGDFAPDRVLALIREKFGAIPRAPAPIPPVGIEEPEQTETRRVKVEKDDQLQAVVIAHKIPAGLDRQNIALALVTRVLSGGISSRLYRRLMDRGVAAGIASDVWLLHDPALLTTLVILSPGVSHETVEAATLEVYEDLKKNGVTEEELNTAKNQIKAELAFTRDGSLPLSEALSEAIGVGDWTLVTRYADEAAGLTVSDIKEAAARYLLPQRMTVGYLVSKTPLPAVEAGPAAAPGAKSEIPREAAPSGDKKTPGAAAAEKIKVLCRKTGLQDVVTVSGSFEGGGTAYSSNPLLAHMVAEMLNKETLSREKFEITKIFDSRGIEVEYSVDYRRIRFRSRMLKEYAPLAIRLIAEQMRFPVFSEEEFAKLRQQMTVDIQARMSDPSEAGRNEFSRALYSPSHPNYSLTPEEQLGRLRTTTLEDLRAFHAANYGPHEGIIMAVGDVDPGVIEDAVRRSFEGWNKPAPAVPYNGGVKWNEPVRKLVPMPGKPNIEVVIGHVLPMNRQSEDYIPALLASYVLGGDFSARLTGRVRDQLGLTYAIHSEIQGVSDDVQGNWAVHLIATAEHAAQAIRETEAQISLFAEKGISEEELERKKSTIIGRYKVDAETSRELADRLLRYEEMRLGSDYAEKFPGLITQLTLPRVNEVIHQYFQPEKLHRIVCGDLTSEKLSVSEDTLSRA